MSEQAAVTDAEVTPGSPERRAARLLDRSFAGRLFCTILLSWLLVGLVSPPQEAQDAIPLVVAGDLVAAHPESVYNGNRQSLYDLNPEFRQRTCAIIGDPARCEDIGVAFISPPTALPILAVISRFDASVSVRLVTFAAALALVAGMVVLWLRLALLSPRAPAALAVTALLVTPLALNPIGLGQSSPLMVLSAALGLAGARTRWWRRAVVVALVLVVAFKAVPAVLLAIVAYERRWKVLIATLAGLVVLTLAAVGLGGTRMVPDFLRSTRAVQGQTVENPYNGGIEAALYRLPGIDLSASTAGTVADGLRLLSLPVLLVVGLRLRGDARWAFAWAAIVALTPLSWWHYSLASLAALGVAISVSGAVERRLLLLPGAALAGLPMSIAASRGWSMAIPKLAWTVGVLVLVAVVGRVGSAVEPSGVDPSTSTATTAPAS